MGSAPVPPYWLVTLRFGFSMAHFNPPNIQDNPHGWGPCAIPDQFKDLPYQPFSKGDRLGKVIHLPLWSLACTHYILNHITFSAYTKSTVYCKLLRSYDPYARFSKTNEIEFLYMGIVLCQNLSVMDDLSEK